MKRIYVIWGGVFGLDGVVTSEGLITMQNQLHIFGPVKGYLQQWSYSCAQDIFNECAERDLSILIGYSGGVPMVSRICNDPLKRKKQRIDLLVNIDGSPAGNIQTVGSNVKKIVNVYDPKPWIFGGGVVRGAPSTDYKINIPHLAFQASSAVRKIIFDAVAAL